MNLKNINLLKITIFLLLITYSPMINSQVTEDWNHRYTGPQASADNPNDFVVDNSGNLYLTGQSIVGGGYYNFITVKFNSSGIRQWIATFSGLPNSNNLGNSIKVDASGNVYVTGQTRAAGGNYDIVTIKYDQNGVQQWIQQYNGPGNFDDVGLSLSIDPSGMIYVGGYSYGSGTGYDFILLKYNSSGVSQWNRRYNGSSNSDDYLKKIVLLSNGDIIAAGSSYDNTTGNDYTTLKYNSSGTLLWTQKYNGIHSTDDQITDMKSDGLDNIYVCGKSVGNGAGYDYATVKYNSGGTQQWVARYNSPSNNDDAANAVDVDPAGNVFVTGYSYQTGSFYDFATIKYNSGGVQQWVKIYNGVENFSDKAIDLKVDASGNSFVTGSCIKISDGTSDCVTLKYDPAGNVLWTKTYNGPGNLDDNPIKLTLDNSGFVYVIATSYSYFFGPLCGSSDYLALKYSTSGIVDWETRFDGSGTGMDEAIAMAIDNIGNTYVTGFSFDNVSNMDFATLKYNSSGAPLWASRYDGGSNGIDKPVAIAVDNSGNVFVTGSSQGSGTGYDILTIKYSPSGTALWTARYNGTANGDDYASGIAIDASGNSYITGSSEGGGSGKDYVTIKYNSSGVQQWATRYNGSSNSNDYASAIAIDGTGNTYVTGRAIGSGTMEDICTVKYNSSGAQQWVSVYNGTSNDSDEASCIALDISGNVIVAGKSKSSISNFDFITIKYNSSGSQQWQASYNGTSNGNDEITSIAVDNSGNVLVTGNAKNLSTDYDYVTIKYNKLGSVQWTNSYNGTSNKTDKALSISVDLSGSSYVTGFSEDIITGRNYGTLKYNSNGIFQWIQKYNYIDNDTDQAAVCKVDTSGNVFVTGFSTSAQSKQDFYTTKYKQDKNLQLKALIEGFYDETSGKMISDTMKVYMRNSFSPYSIIDSSTSVLDSLGNGTFGFKNVQNGINYFIVLNHRNSIETWSAAGISFVSGDLSYDFTTNASKAYGNNMKQKGIKFCIYSGDVDRDGQVDLSDIVTVYNAVSIFTKGYDVSDLNGDLVVDLSDLIIAYNNSYNFVSEIRP